MIYGHNKTFYPESGYKSKKIKEIIHNSLSKVYQYKQKKDYLSSGEFIAKELLDEKKNLKNFVQENKYKLANDNVY